MSTMPYAVDAVNCQCSECQDDPISLPAELWPDWCDEDCWTISPEFKTLEEWERDELADDHLANLAYVPTADEEAEYREWAAACEARQHLDTGERMTMAEVIDRQVAFYRGFGNPLGEMLAEHMAELAELVRVTGASTPAEHDARIDCLDREYA